MPNLTIDLVLSDPKNDEYVLCLVETGPWPEVVETRLRQLQDRLYNTFDAAVDGHVAAKFPDSMGMKIRVQVDSHDDPPESVPAFVRKFAAHLETNTEYREAIGKSIFIQALRVVNGCDLGRNFA